MPKIENGSLLNLEDIETARCCTCSAPLTFERNKNNEYITSCCDRDYRLVTLKLQAIVTKNANVVIRKEKEHIEHKPKESNWKPYV